MKTTKYLFILTIPFLFACKKNYTCACDYYANGNMVSSQTETLKDTKKGAKKTCTDKNVTSTQMIFGMPILVESKCKIK